MSSFDDWRGRRVRAARTAEARVLEEVTEDLALARRLLPASGSPDRMARFDEAILRGDLAAALVELESIGLANGPTPEYWHALAAASARMGMDEVRVRLEGWGGRAASVGGRAEPDAAADGGGRVSFSGFQLTAAPAAAELGRSAAEGCRVPRFICLACRATREVADAAPEANACPCCGAAMALVDPVAADTAILREAVEPVRPDAAWRTIRRELVIGLAWGLALAGLVIYPLRVESAYRDAAGRVHNYPPGVFRDEAGGRVYLPGTSALGWGEWLALLAGECGTVAAGAGGIGVVVGVGKWLRGRR